MRPPSRLTELANLDMKPHRKNYCAAMMMINTLKTDAKDREGMDYMQSKDFACVGVVIGGGFQNTKEIHVMKYKESMATNDK